MARHDFTVQDPRLALAKDILPRLLEGSDERLAVLRTQLDEASVCVRGDTNWGFFADVLVSRSAQRLASPDFCGGDAQIEIEGLRTPAGCVLHVEDGALSYLEVYSFDEPWESPPKFGKILRVRPIIPGENVRRSDNAI